MSLFRLIFASFWFYRRSHVVLALGAAAGTAVLTGALLVGDSMWASLRHLALVRLGRVEEALLSPRMFRERLADELAADPGFRGNYSAAIPAILLTCSVSETTSARRANQVTLIGCPERFWTLSGDNPGLPGPQQIALNRVLAERLKVQSGQGLVLHLPAFSAIPADSALGRKQETVRTERVTVSAILPDEGLGQFSLQMNQQTPLNAYVPLEWLQDRLQQRGCANTLLVIGKKRGLGASLRLEKVLRRPWQPALADYGLQLRRTERGYLQVTSERMLIEPTLETELLHALSGQEVQPVLTYLANAIACGERQIPYSTVAALDFVTQEPLGPFLRCDGGHQTAVTEGEIVLNQWAADQLHAKQGDTVRLQFFEPESAHGELRQQWAEFRLVGILSMQGAALDRELTPEVTGVTDASSIADWDPPFPFDARQIRPQDEEYWERYRATPKAYVSLAAGHRLWGSRFGRSTALRIAPQPGVTPTALEQKLQLPPAVLGMKIQPVKEQALAAATGTTPFSVLFLAFSSFTIAAAAMLVALQFRLSVEARSSQLGLLTAVGWNRQLTARLMLGEGLCIAAAGCLAGMVLGIGYAALMLAGLESWWLAAIVTPFLQLYIDPASLWLGLGCGLILAMAAIALSLLRVLRFAPRPLLAGQLGAARTRSRTSSTVRSVQIGLLLVLIVSVVGPLAGTGDDDQRIELFFGAAAATLIASLGLVATVLHTGRTGPAIQVGRGNLARMALRCAARNPGRSALSIGLVASTAFLIAAVSAFRIDPDQQVIRREAGNGGFALVAQSSQPIYVDLNRPEGRRDAGLAEADESQLAKTTVIALRVNSGDDASCLNLYQASRPRVLGVPQAMTERGGFAWASSLAETLQEHANPWLLLTAKRFSQPTDTPRLPVVMEKNTALYALHLTGGVGSLYDLPDGRGGTIPMIVVGLLDNSILQGDLLISEEAFCRLFPDISGRQLFLIETPPDQVSEVAQTLERGLGDFGLSAQTSQERLAAFVAVQNTYLSAFQSLGGLGLLLGTLGLGAVQVRNVFERRRELALLLALGVRRGRLASMVLLENTILLLVGLSCGLLAALMAVLPHILHGTASLPWRSLAVIFALVLSAGLLSGVSAVRILVSQPLLPFLREE